MGSQEITLFGLLAISLLMVPLFIINKIIGLKLNKSLFIGILRMALQLALVSVYLQFLFEKNRWWLNLLYVCIMLVVSGFTITKSCNLKRKNFMLLIFVGMAIPLLSVLFYLTAYVINIDYIFDARYIVTISGMLMGNCMRGIIIGINSFYNDIKENEATYLLYLSFGATRNQALKPKIIKAMESAIKPAIATMMVTGLVSLPGMMTGQILGGALPINAVMYQFMIMLAIFIVEYVGVGLMLKLAIAISFNKRDILRKDIFIK